MPSLAPSFRRVDQRQGFTLLEVLMAVSVIVILMAIIIPAIGGAQTSAKRAKTRVQFSQWSAAIEQFRQEYGYYPNWGTGDSGSSFASGLINSAEKTQRFVECLSGRRINGDPYLAADPGYLAGNTKRISFCTFGSGDLTTGSSPLLQDAFGNASIVVLTDKNLSGSITFSGSNPDYASLPGPVTAAGGSSVPSPVDTATIIRAGVAFYSAGDGQTPVTSW